VEGPDAGGVLGQRASYQRPRNPPRGLCQGHRHGQLEDHHEPSCPEPVWWPSPPSPGDFNFRSAITRLYDAAYKNMLQALVARHGEHLKLAHLREAVEGATLRGQTKQTLMELFEQLGKMYTESETLMQHVGQAPVFVLLRGRYLPRNFVNPMQAVLFNALCRSTQNGDPARMVLMEEGLKALCGNAALREFMVGFQETGRHRPVSAVVAVQHVKGM